MSDFRFESPQYVFALWGVAVLSALLIWLEFKRGGALRRLVAATMQPRLVIQGSRPQRLASIGLLTAASVCFVIGLMRPQYGLTFVKTSRVGAQIMFCLDVSKSMLAEDAAPNRLERAKADINDLLTYLDGDQVGLIGFAGRAAVLCPLTPDYGFFKMVLEDAGPSSVGLGGTRLEEPLRKALDGFRNESDVSRVIFLITDGEDHDSKPLDVADDAIERGIKVVAVGLGDESGSELRITDPKTGIQSTVTDADGRPVISRLDGETLREMALATEGVYIPAGTGTLDLKSIYDTHLRPLVRNEMQREGRAVRREAFQWALLAGLLLMMAGIWLARIRPRDTVGEPATATASLARNTTAAILALFLCLPSLSLSAADPSPASGESESAGQAKVKAEEVEKEPVRLPPRTSFNQGLAALQSDPDTAEKRFTSARVDAGSDGEVRYRATYNLGWVEVVRADAVMQSDPKAALTHLERAAGWFRDAIRLRDDSTDARHNLEAVLRRALQLRDQLARQAEQSLEEALDGLIARLRTQSVQIRDLVQGISERDDPNAADLFRSEFSKLAVDQRVALSDLQGISEQGVVESEGIEATPPAERQAESELRLAQLNSAFDYLNQTAQRLGQSRSQLRRRQASRSFRRTAAALAQLKGARDQLRDPLQRIESLLTETLNLSNETGWKSQENSPIAGTSTPPPPVWLEREYLIENQTALAKRTDQLTRQLQAGLASAESNPDTTPGTETKDNQGDPRVMKKLVRAMPFMERALESMNSAELALQSESYSDAAADQLRAVEAFQMAREQFADLKTLIELTYSDETAISRLVDSGGTPQITPNDEETIAPPQTTIPDETDDNELIEIREAAAQLQSSNLERMVRLIEEIDFAYEEAADKAKGEASDPGMDTPANNSFNGSAQDSPEQQRLKVAQNLAQRAKLQMEEVLRFARSAPEMQPPGSNQDSNASEEKQTDVPDQPSTRGEREEADAEPERPTVTDSSETESPASSDSSLVRESPLSNLHRSVEQTVDTLQDLRRLFFTVVQHLQETAERQASLNDETEQAAGLDDASSEKESPEEDRNGSRLASRQEQLKQMTDMIRETLEQQGESSASSPDDDVPAVDPQQQEMLQENAERSAAAAKLVGEAADHMVESAELLLKSPANLSEARPPQDASLEKLIEALRELQPPQDDQSSQGDSGQQNQPQDQQQEPSPDESSQQSQPSAASEAEDQGDGRPQNLSPSRMLQAVRDREAQRRKERSKRQTIGQAPVEKDW